MITLALRQIKQNFKLKQLPPLKLPDKQTNMQKKHDKEVNTYEYF